MLTVDESQFEHALAAVRGQEGCEVSFEVFGAFDEREAHRRLYSSLNRSRNQFDVRCKVDADMVIVHPRLFASAAQTFEQSPELDAIIVPLHDFYTDAEIKGLMLWSPRVRWTSNPRWIFADAAANTARNVLTVKNLRAPVVLHAPDPALEQSVRFGSHRALKGLAKGPQAKNWQHFRSVLAAFRSDPQPGRAIALAAGLDAATGPRLEDHLAAVTSGPPLSLDMVMTLAAQDCLVERFEALLTDERALSRACADRGPRIRARLEESGPQRDRAAPRDVASRLLRPIRQLLAPGFDRAAARDLFTTLIG